MKKRILLTTILLPISLLYAEPQEVQQVIDITPDKPAQVEESRPLSLPTPPVEIKAEDIKITDLKTTTTPTKPSPKKPAKSVEVKEKETKKTKKAIADMSQEEQVTYLKHKIDKLRKKSHTTRAKIHELETKVQKLEKEVELLKSKENKNSNKTQGE